MAVRNRPRPSLVKEDIADEQNLWNSIVEKIRRCGAVNKKFDDVQENIPLAENKLAVLDRRCLSLILSYAVSTLSPL